MRRGGLGFAPPRVVRSQGANSGKVANCQAPATHTGLNPCPRPSYSAASCWICVSISFSENLAKLAASSWSGFCSAVVFRIRSMSRAVSGLELTNKMVSMTCFSSIAVVLLTQLVV